MKFRLQAEIIQCGNNKIKSLTTVYYNTLEILNSKMEVQGISDSQNLTDSKIYLEKQEGKNKPILDQFLEQNILGLLGKGFPIFIFDQKSQKQNQDQIQFSSNEKQQNFNDRILTYNRKAKSLEQLSKKFIDHFEGRTNPTIQLDKITLELGVERRRIYDVINILESLNVVSKKGKNNYEWKGLYEAVRTINACLKEGSDYKFENIKKQKSLEYLAGGFLKLFISWKPAISLQQAARQMMKDLDQSSIKTKIRRLYDIINVFRSLGLVRKVQLSSKKPGYQWAGTQNLQQMISRKQFNDDYTKMSELNQQDFGQQNQDKQSQMICTRIPTFSPLICPLLSKSNSDYIKQIIQTKQTVQLFQDSNKKNWFEQDLIFEKNEFPIFHRSTSAFRLVGQQN